MADEESSGSEGPEVVKPTEGGAAAAAKKKRKRKKKPAAAAAAAGAADPATAAAAPAAAAPAPALKPQTWPEPTVPLRFVYPPLDFPCGEIVVKSAAGREAELAAEAARGLDGTRVVSLRRAAEVHRQVRTWAHTWLRPGLTLMEIANRIEAKVALLVEREGLLAGHGFPTGLSINSCAAHATPNPGDKAVLGGSDVLKVDFGVHVNGFIVDSAFTVCFDPRFDELKEAVLDATNTGLKAAGPDVRLVDIGAAIQEAMESHEVAYDGNSGKVHPVKCVRNLFGHSIDKYRIHGGKSIPIVRGVGEGVMLAGEQFAIETFGSTGKGYVRDEGECSHYALAHDFPGSASSLRNPKAQALFRHIEKEYHTLPWCRKWLEADFPKHQLALKALVDCGAVTAYPPLCDNDGSYVAQYEHTFLVREWGVEVVSRGDDY